MSECEEEYEEHHEEEKDILDGSAGESNDLQSKIGLVSMGVYG